ncbi:MAG: NAD-dependent epimerase/dehydratase family protein [Actinobacteria bacterium]|nr:NAD-dependent epimerase/dehydratase family protein [Actinomycetota bacterium]
MTARPARVLVTGGAGFIGSHIVEALVADDVEVVVLDSLVAAAVDPARLPAGVELVVGDVRDPDAWRRAVAGCDAVCHQAARVGLGVDFGDVRDYVEDNDLGTAVGLLVLHETGFAGRIVLASSMVVYGEGRSRCPEHGVVAPPPRLREDVDAGRFEPRCPVCGADVEPEDVSEDVPTDPRNVYAATKLHQEHLTTVFGRDHGVPVTALRYHNVYGPRLPADTPYAGVAAIFRSSVARGEPPRVYEDGGQRRDFVHVRDVARANVAALLTDRPYDGPLNVASGTPRTVLDLARAVAEPAGLEPQVVGGGRLGDVRHIVASPQRAADTIGFRAVEPFDPNDIDT